MPHLNSGPPTAQMCGNAVGSAGQQTQRSGLSACTCTASRRERRCLPKCSTTHWNISNVGPQPCVNILNQPNHYSAHKSPACPPHRHHPRPTTSSHYRNTAISGGSVAPHSCCPIASPPEYTPAQPTSQRHIETTTWPQLWLVRCDVS